MNIDLRGVKALQQLRIELEDSAGTDFPNRFRREMLLLYDVCKTLKIPITHARSILGSEAYEMVTNHINAPVSAPPMFQLDRAIEWITPHRRAASRRK